MKTIYRGYEIEVKRERALGGWDNAYMSVVRQSDGLVIIDTFSEGADPVRVFVKCMKNRVDQFIETKGASELLEDDYGENETLLTSGSTATSLSAGANVAAKSKITWANNVSENKPASA